jgi:DNA-directed RNA polymerase specialized sigma24 family protein
VPRVTNEQTAQRYIARIAQHADELAARDRALAAMHLEDGLTQAEIARRLGVTESMVRLAVKVHGPTIRARLAQLAQAS